jgi:N-acetylmuramoyl-L-alanine amidase
LIELGFSNKKKEYLDSEAGQEQMALQIANSIIQYKKIYFGANASLNNVLMATITKKKWKVFQLQGSSIYKIQLLASSKVFLTTV